MKAISLDLRKLVITDCDAGMKTGKVAAKASSQMPAVLTLAFSDFRL